ncbi:putative RING finger and transmembrane domain-containing protein, partial [Naja naja]
NHHTPIQLSEASSFRTMQSTPNVRHTGLNNGHSHSPACQGPHAMRSPGEEPCQHAGDVHIQMTSAVGEPEANAGSRQHPRLGTQSRPHGQTPGEARSGHSGGSATEEQRDSSLSEFKYLLQWLHRSAPYILILSIKILVQHIIGSVSTSRHFSGNWAAHNFYVCKQSHCKSGFPKRKVLQTTVYVAAAVLDGIICFHLLHLLLSVASLQLDPLKPQGGFFELLGGALDCGNHRFRFEVRLHEPEMHRSPAALFYHVSQIQVVPAPVWFRYFVGLRELDGTIGWSFGILLALLYLILKSYGVVASRRQRAEADNLCAICQAEFQKPVVLLCQHIFCDECIALWLNREKTCPLCRTVLSTHVNKWHDGATSAQLQLY